jgi:hypothetical protein
VAAASRKADQSRLSAPRYDTRRQRCARRMRCAFLCQYRQMTHPPRLMRPPRQSGRWRRHAIAVSAQQCRDVRTDVWPSERTSPGDTAGAAARATVAAASPTPIGHADDWGNVDNWRTSMSPQAPRVRSEAMLQVGYSGRGCWTSKKA